MKTLRTLIALALPAIAVPMAFSAPVANAAPRGADLVTTFVAPTSTLVGSVSHYEVRIANVGQRASGPVTLTIQLPTTNTSPQVLVMGQLSNIQPGQCAAQGTRITCTLPGIARNGVTPVGFDIRHPYSTAPITFRADATTNNETDSGNNGASFTLAQSFHTVSAAAPAPVTVKSCTGTNLTSFFECTSFPSSIMQHQTTLAPGGVLDFSSYGPEYDGVTGIWSVNGSGLSMTYTQAGETIGTFTGQGASANCWEGRMDFGAPYVAIYQVCR